MDLRATRKDCPVRDLRQGRHQQALKPCISRKADAQPTGYMGHIWVSLSSVSILGVDLLNARRLEVLAECVGINSANSWTNIKNL